jgi:hypothetical protein
MKTVLKKICFFAKLVLTNKEKIHDLYSTIGKKRYLKIGN